MDLKALACTSAAGRALRRGLGGIDMSGDWIKMRSNLWDDPRVAKLCDMTDQAEAAVVGALYWLWAAADQHTVDGLLPGLTIRQLDRKTGVLGIGAALLSIGWLTESDAGLAVVKFEEHNGSSAKRRGIEAQRKGLVRKVSASDADKTRTDAGQVAPLLQPIAELEKEKELKHTHTALARDWRLPEPWGQQTLEAYPHWTAETARVIAATFADHHWSAGSTSSDW